MLPLFLPPSLSLSLSLLLPTGPWQRTCSTRSSGASSAPATTPPTSHAACAVSPTCTWPRWAACWTTTCHTPSTRGARPCSMRPRSGWTSSAPAAWRRPSWRRWHTFAKPRLYIGSDSDKPHEPSGTRPLLIPLSRTRWSLVTSDCWAALCWWQVDIAVLIKLCGTVSQNGYRISLLNLLSLQSSSYKPEWPQCDILHVELVTFFKSLWFLSSRCKRTVDLSIQSRE